LRSTSSAGSGPSNPSSTSVGLHSWREKLRTFQNKLQITKKAQLTQRGTHDSGACLNARCEQNLCSPIPATMFYLHSSDGATGLAQPHISLKSHIFPTPCHLALLLGVTPFEFMEQFCMDRETIKSSRQPLAPFWTD